MFYSLVIIIVFFLVFVLARLIYRFLTRDYKQVSGVLVDYKTESFYGNDSHYYVHKPIVEFYIDGKCYRLVKEFGFTSHRSDWPKTRLKKYLNMTLLVKYDEENPHRCYLLITPRLLFVRFIYNLPEIIILLIFYVIVVLYLYTQIKK